MFTSLFFHPKHPVVQINLPQVFKDLQKVALLKSLYSCTNSLSLDADRNNALIPDSRNSTTAEFTSCIDTEPLVRFRNFPSYTLYVLYVHIYWSKFLKKASHWFGDCFTFPSLLIYRQIFPSWTVQSTTATSYGGWLIKRSPELRGPHDLWPTFQLEAKVPEGAPEERWSTPEFHWMNPGVATCFSPLPEGCLSCPGVFTTHNCWTLDFLNFYFE